MHFLTTEKALHTFTLPTEFRGGSAALNQAGKPKYERKKPGNAKNVCCREHAQNQTLISSAALLPH